MEEMHIRKGDRVHRIYVLRHTLDGGGTSSLQSEIPQQIVVEGNARADVVLLVFPGISADIKLDVHLVGEGAEANVYGAYVCGGEEKVKIAVDMYHDEPHCNSRQLFKGIAGGVSKVDFYGKIIVAQDAQRTEAYQENHNILLTDGAKVDTKPQLEIYADDVKCSHGATIGRLNEEEQFYMRSRGISLEDAKVLQMISFIAPVLEHVEDETQRDALTARIESEIRNIIRNI
ncbi:MAG: SufD family Fe-S cluster assembly protein [Bacteroidales bacterium]|nr:SufD family Fe-S cluster assembly protein [Bacteroidales bacterium]